MDTAFRIKGMSCGHCVRAVETALRAIPGIKEVKVTIGEAVVTTEGEVDERRVREAIEQEGFEPI